MVMESPYVVMTISTAAMATAVAMVAEVDSSMMCCAFGSLAMSQSLLQGAEFNNSDSIFIQKVIEIGLDFNSIQFNSILTYRARFQFNFNSNCWPNEGSHFRFNSISSTVSLRKYGEFPLQISRNQLCGRRPEKGAIQFNFISILSLWTLFHFSFNSICCFFMRFQFNFNSINKLIRIVSSIQFKTQNQLNSAP